MRFCKRCGNKLNDNVKFCGKCGLENEAKIENVKVENTAREEVKEPNINEEAKLREEVRLKEEARLWEESKRREEEKLREESRARVSLEKPKVDLQKERVQSSGEKLQKPKNVETKKKKSNGKIIGIALVCVIAAGGALGYFLYDDILYKKYKNDVEATSSVSEKFVYYDKIAKLEKFDEVKGEVIKLLKNDSSNIGYLKRMENVKDEEKNKIALDVLKADAISKYDNGQYEDAKKILDEASKYGYNLNDALYTNVIMKLNENNSGQSIGTDTGVTENEEDMLFKDSSDRYLNEEELRIYSKEELAIARNEIYARHGYVFNQEPFKSYFNEKDWYTKDSSFKGSDSELNDYEVKNIQLLLKLEKER
ncbi:MAG: YARHG domain-containing protein [Clostridium sp.]|uniref:YARHG domain-containing protein n=1 Tax=Clostridium sp. TaxID=1506 RepID=UPI003F3F20A4